MKYFELTIKAGSCNDVEKILAEKEIYSYVINDPKDALDILEHKEIYKWDYVSEEIKNLSDIKYSEVKVYFDNKSTAVNIAANFSDYETRIDEIDDAEWKYSYKEHFQPIKITNNLRVVPSWEGKIADENTIILDPGMAFGTGNHETTSMCSELLSKQNLKGKVILDVGTGSGILAIVAAKLGAKKVLGLDIDTDAVNSALSNVVLNGLEDKITIKKNNLVNNLNFNSDIICANLVAESVCELIKNTESYLKIGGVLISSGILREKEKTVVDTLAENNFEIKHILRRNEWIAIEASLGK